VNCPVEKTDGGAVIFIAEVHGIQQVGGVTSLLDPVTSAIGCSQDYAIIADYGANVGVDEMHAEKVYSVKWIT
jgi:hypothetical protein